MWSKVIYSVPHGTLFGPILFLLFNNNVHSVVINSKIKSYADDLKIYRLINNEEDSLVLQADLDCI